MDRGAASRHQKPPPGQGYHRPDRPAGVPSGRDPVSPSPEASGKDTTVGIPLGWTEKAERGGGEAPSLRSGDPSREGRPILSPSVQLGPDRRVSRERAGG